MKTEEIVAITAGVAITALLAGGMYYKVKENMETVSDMNWEKYKEEQKEKEATEAKFETTNPLYRGSKRKTKKRKTSKRKTRR